MKKKIMVLVIGLIVAIGFYINYVNEENIKVSQQWDLTDEQMSDISLKGISQDVLVVLEQGDKNSVSITGEIPKSFGEKLKEIQPNKNKMLISFVTDIGVSVAKNSKEKLIVTVQSKNTDVLKKLNIQMNKGNVVVKVPNNFERNYDLVTNQGQVNNSKQNKQTSTGQIKVELGFGNIDIIE
ncbi:hypothetical protein [Enterococcus termitis]|uniref:Adhesin domain-containing protein n=1 Tax=Enterococcus termitis TaxID=332950 RepID=A0A1E5H0U4_9ENTE|nr:hypothetical protein [Enterococcus termitis]OEG18415.1 hypothetical protein BCR25_16445 [Enterococcus termitis]OJG96978.1 hypothetical protein RV18_GL001327 [Enterococcus termitis]